MIAPLRLSILLLLTIAVSGCVTESKQMDTQKRQNLADIHYQLGIDALGKEGMLPKAFKELMRSDELRPNQPNVLDALAYAWLLRGDLKKSEQFYKKALHHGGTAATHNNYANLLNRMQRYPEAEREARKALDDPRYPNQDLAYINLGNALLGQQRIDEAINSYRSAKMFAPNSLLVETKLAQALALQGDQTQAAHHYRAILARDPDSRPAAEGLLKIYRQQQAWPAARALLRDVIDRSTIVENRSWATEELRRLPDE